MNRYNELKLQALSLFAATQGEWLGPNEAAQRLNFSPARSAWTYFKRLWSFGLLERRSRGRGTLEYRITDLGRSRLRALAERLTAQRNRNCEARAQKVVLGQRVTRENAFYSARSSEAGSILTACRTGRSAATTAPARIASMGNASICKSVGFTS